MFEVYTVVLEYSSIGDYCCTFALLYICTVVLKFTASISFHYHYYKDSFKF